MPSNDDTRDYKMPMPSAKTLQRLAQNTGHQAGTLEKVLRLLDLLQEIASDPLLSGGSP